MKQSNFKPKIPEHVPYYLMDYQAYEPGGEHLKYSCFLAPVQTITRTEYKLNPKHKYEKGRKSDSNNKLLQSSINPSSFE